MVLDVFADLSPSSATTAAVEQVIWSTGVPHRVVLGVPRAKYGPYRDYPQTRIAQPSGPRPSFPLSREQAIPSDTSPTDL
ncbi:hypothetical protein DTO280E4_396 [Paecilomyces variotii]|nr:hypothetical protein DTO280E4_396 [Paecilomyces variotii]